MSDERKLATVEEIQSLEPIDGADRIELARIRGWNVVVQKGLYEPGSKVVFFEIDSMLDVEKEQFKFLADSGVRTDADGFRGHVVKTKRLRGQYSQGLAVPVEEFELTSLEPGNDVTNELGIRKWEPPIPANLAGQVRGHLPGWVRKTDAERIQNVVDWLPLTGEYYCTEKLDGSSGTFTLNNDDFHVCSRNLSLKESEGNTFWEIARKYDLLNVLYTMQEEYGVEVATIQGEVFGEGINGNRLGLKGHHFRAFNLEANGEPIQITFADYLNVPRVPDVDLEPPQTLEEALAQVDGMKSALSKDRLAEGVVWRRRDGKAILDGVRSIKVISNKYLLKSE